MTTTGSDYYDPHPRLLLARPLVLMGHPASGSHAVGRILCGLTGLPFNPVRRLVEARLGRSAGRVAVEEGLQSLHSNEWDVLKRSIERNPFGVVVVDPAVLVDADALTWSSERTLLLHLQRPISFLLKKLRQRIEAEPGCLPDFVLGAPRNEQELTRHLEPRQAVLDSADLVLNGVELPPLDIAREILSQLEKTASIGDLGGRTRS
jgi:shikimate kinase